MKILMPPMKLLFVKAGLLKAVIYIGCDHKIVFLLHQMEKLVIYGFRRIRIAIDIDIPAPVRPVFLRRVVRIESAGIHILPR